MFRKEIIRLAPVFKQMIWGGNRLRTDWHYDIPGDDTGECWGISAHPNGDCSIAEGKFRGKTLSQLWIEQPDLFGNVDSDRFPLLVKIIDARQDLSIQVHPDDEYAAVHENGSLGKTECWYILDASEDATLVVGHNATTKQELHDMIDHARWEAFIREIPVKKGDFIQIEPGTIHAIKGGVLLIETQQNSDITYRVYDYDRLSDGKPRELHVEKSKDVITVPAKSVADSILHVKDVLDNEKRILITCEYYQVWMLNVTSDMSFEQEEPFLNISVIEGKGSLNGVSIKKGDHLILPSGYGRVELHGEMQIIASSVKK